MYWKNKDAFPQMTAEESDPPPDKGEDRLAPTQAEILTLIHVTSRLRKKAFQQPACPLCNLPPKGGELKKGSQFNRRVWKDVSLRNWFFRTLLVACNSEIGIAGNPSP